MTKDRAHAIRAMLGWAERCTTFKLLALPLLIALLTGCEGRPPSVVLWHAYDGTERDALQATGARWNLEHPDRPLELVAVPFGAFGDKLTSAIPNGNGPDLFIYPEDRIGDWADSGVIEPIEFWIDDARADRFTTEAMEAMSYKGSLWGLPLTVKSLVMFYRTDLVATPPKTTDELLALAPRLRERGAYALAYTNVDLYGHAPWLFGFGGTIMNDAGELAIATPQAAAAMAFARTLIVNRVSPQQADGPHVSTLFNAAKAAAVISGPWFVAGINKDVPWRAALLPTVSSTGTPATPFRGADG